MRLAEALKELQDERAALVLKSAPIRMKRDKLREKMQPMEDELRSLNEQVKSVEGTRLFELDNEIAAIVRALKNTKTLHAEGK